MAPRMSSRSGMRYRGGGANVTLRVDKRAIIDVMAHAEYIAKAALDRIRERAEKGQGYKGALPQLKDSTLDRYERQTKDGPITRVSGGTRSLLWRTGQMLTGLRYRIRATAKVVYAKIMGAEGDNRRIGFVGARRPFLGLSPSDFKRISARGSKTVKVKSVRG